jgi:hypothetical protein
MLGTAGTVASPRTSAATRPFGRIAPLCSTVRQPARNLYNGPMANRAYASFWTRDYSEALMLDRFERWLETIPVSAERPGFASLVIRAVESSEAPILEHDFLAGEADAAAVVALAREHQNADCAYEVEAHWDLWHRGVDSGLWQRGPQRLLLICQSEAYDNGVAAESGHFLADLGLEHLYTGHAGLLGTRPARSAPADPLEAEFLALMTDEEHLREYHEKTRQNIQQLLDWTRAVEQALPVDRTVLWSEGEENLEARLDEILAVH